MGRSDQKGGVDRLRFGKVPSGHCVEDRREAGAEGRRGLQSYREYFIS